MHGLEETAFGEKIRGLDYVFAKLALNHLREVLSAYMNNGDIVLGNAIINILKELLDRRGIRYKLVESTNLLAEFEFIPLNVGAPEKIVSIEVDDAFKTAAGEVLNEVFTDVKRLREEMEKVARMFIRDEAELREYLERVGEVYGWW
jgi:hypothetical protein